MRVLCAVYGDFRPLKSNASVIYQKISGVGVSKFCFEKVYVRRQKLGLVTVPEARLAAVYSFTCCNACRYSVERVRLDL